jgi:hypothetical protein
MRLLHNKAVRYRLLVLGFETEYEVPALVGSSWRTPGNYQAA